jgi:alkanesulfonate monooxygenase SsuD/methylene tetrahydromethanopterin reductase-like flavin-dependent oxidoreductase (luciferase family)
LVRFGYSPAPDAGDYEDIVRRVRLADRLGLDIVGIQDHPYQRRFVDTMSLIADLAARTEQIAFFPDVVCLPLRPPAMLAKAAATIDLTSGGRFELGLGAGAFWDAIEGCGGPVRTPPEALATTRPCQISTMTSVPRAPVAPTCRRCGPPTRPPRRRVPPCPP